MKYHNLNDFLDYLADVGELKTISLPVSPKLEITEICHRSLAKNGPALLFTNVENHSIPLLGNLFASEQRIALAMGKEKVSDLTQIGELLSFLRQPEPPANIKEAFSSLPIFKQILNMAPKVVNKAPCQEIVLQGSDVALNLLPIQTCWPKDIAPLITWGLTVTKGPNKKRTNLGIYRQQLLTKNKLIMRWLPHRGGALDYKEWVQKYNSPFPVSVVIGACPATTLAAVTPIPDNLSEYAFAGLLRGNKTELVKCKTNDLLVPSSAQIVLEGVINPNESAPEGPFGDHTGYYNEVETFPVFTVNCITMKKNPIYHSTYTGKPIDEPAVLGVAFNYIFTPLLKKQFPEIVDCYLPPEGCSYRIAIISIDKKYPGHARQVMLGFWSYLRQFMYTKFVIVVDKNIDIRNWSEVMWAISTKVDPSRDIQMLENTPIDYLDFASKNNSLGSKMGIDATDKIGSETTRAWGETITMTKSVQDRIDSIWQDLGL